MRAVRGAIRVVGGSAEEVLDATERLLLALLERNRLTAADVVSAFFTATPDLRSAFPAAAARRIGFGAVPLLCAQEIDVDGAMPGVVRVLLQFEGGADRIEPVYLDGAEALRDDLS